MLKSLLFTTILTLFAIPAYGAPLKIKDSKVEFLAVGNPGFLEIEGKGGKITTTDATIEGSIVAGTFKVKLDDLDTGMDLRNRHMKEKYLKTGAYPDAILKMDSSDITKGVFTGVLTVKKDSKKIKGKILSASGGRITASFKINVQDFPSIGVPSWLGVTVADEVEIKVELRMSITPT